MNPILRTILCSAAACLALDGADGLFLDITGCSHLFGGEQALVADMLRRFPEQGIEARAAVADTAGAAWAVARFHGDAVVPEGTAAGWLTPLPPAALTPTSSAAGK